MSHVTLVFGTEDGDVEHVECTRVQQLAPDVQLWDYIACPHTGFVHVHGVRRVGRVVYIEDCHGHEHIYRASDLLELARPTTVDA